MTDIIETVIKVLPQAQQIAVRALLEQKKRQGDLRSLRSYEAEARKLYGNLRDKLGVDTILTPKYVSPGDPISSEDHNSNMEEIFLDLSSLYYFIDNLAKNGKQQSVTLQSEYFKSRSAVQKLINDARVFAIRKKYPEFNDIKIIDFNVNKNNSKTVPTAYISDKTRLLQLRPLDSTRVHLVNRTTRDTKIYTKTYASGIKGTLSKSFPVEGMVDQKPETFWGTLLLSEIPVSQVYNKTSRANEEVQISVDGPVVEIYFRFSHAERINHIRLLPFGEYPINIVDVSYRPSLSSQVMFPLEDFEPTSTLDWVEINFEPVFAQEVRVTVAQENFRKIVYHLPKKLVSNTDLFQIILDLKAKELVGDAVVGSDFYLESLSTIDNYTRAVKDLNDIMELSSMDFQTSLAKDYTEDVFSNITEILEVIDDEVRASLYESINSKEMNDSSDIVEIKKYEYIIGMREVEIGYELYSPIGYYESEKFDTQATIAEVQIEVDEFHPSFKTQWQSDYRKTSTEWSIDIGDGRIVPIHPRNLKDTSVTDLPYVKDELMSFDFKGTAFTRLLPAYEALLLKKDGQVVPLTKYSVDKSYTTNNQTAKISVSGDYLDVNSTYTVDYAVAQVGHKIDILSLFKSRELSSPEIFNSVGANKEVILKKFPFINYEIVNRTGLFTKDPDYSRWLFKPPVDNLASGQLIVRPTIFDPNGNILVTGSITGVIITGFYGARSGQSSINTATLSNTYLNNYPYGYFLQVADIKDVTEITGKYSSSGLYLASPPQLTSTQIDRLPTGAFSGSLTVAPYSGILYVDYIIGVGVKTDDGVFAINNLEYEPLSVKVGGKKAKNITNYETLVHPAFSVANRKDGEYEYIHAGKKIYFSQDPVGQEISVQYRWITEYIKLLGLLRCNTQINPSISPRVNECRILINNLII